MQNNHQSHEEVKGLSGEESETDMLEQLILED
jgi:hypothetical protein